MIHNIGKKYFPSGKYQSFHDLKREDVSKMIVDFIEGDFSDFSKESVYEFISNSPNIPWMIEISERLDAIDLDTNLGPIGTGLTTEKGKRQAREIAKILSSSS